MSFDGGQRIRSHVAKEVHATFPALMRLEEKLPLANSNRFRFVLTCVASRYFFRPKRCPSIQRDPSPCVTAVTRKVFPES